MFEFFFKYSPVVFSRGNFVFLSPWPLWALWLMMALGAGWLAWQIHRNQGLLSGLRPAGVWILQTALVALVLFLLWHPALSVATLRPQQNVIAVVVDESRSMSLNDAGGTREAAAKSVLDSGVLKGLSDRFQVRLYRFGKEPERIQQAA